MISLALRERGDARYGSESAGTVMIFVRAVIFDDDTFHLM